MPCRFLVPAIVRRFATTLSSLSLLLCLTAQPASATALYWDVNGTSTGFGTITGTWNTTNAFWNNTSTGTGGTLVATTTNADDLNISGGTTGTITVSGAQVASSIRFSANVATTISSGTSITIGGTGTSSGIFGASTAASTISTPILLNPAVSAISYSNSSTGLLTIGATTGGSAAAHTITVGSSSTGGITLNGIIANGASGGTVGLVINSSGTGVTTITGANTFTGGVSIRSGNVTVGVSNSGTTSGAFGPSTVGVTLGDSTGSANATILSGNTVSNAITVAAGSTGNTLTLGNSTATNGATFSGALILNHDLSVVAQGTGSVTLSGAISGASNLAISGTGNATISNAGSTYSGNLSFSAGQLNLNETGALGGSTGTFIFSGQRLDNTAGNNITLTSNKAQQWNSDFTYMGSRNLTMGSGTVTINGNRLVAVNSTLSGTTLAIGGGISDGGNGYSFTKAGAGALTVSGASTYSGATVVTGGTLNYTSANSSLANTSSVSIAGGTMLVGVGSGTGVANRINPNASLTLGGTTGGGSFQIVAGASGPVNSQTFTTLTQGVGSNVLLTGTTNSGTLSFTGAGASVYNRVVGSTLRFQSLGTSSSLFVNAPTGSSVIGSGSSAILIGAVSGVGSNIATDFVQATAGTLTAPAYVNNTWASGNNTNITQNRTIAAGAVTQSLRFNDSVPRTVTLSGTSTIESGGILVTSNATGANTVNQPQSITGGSIQAASGKDLWVFVAGTSPTDLSISSLIADNGGSSLTKAGARTLYLTNASNSYAGGTYLNEGTLNVTSGGTLGAASGALNFGGSATLQAGASNVDLGTRSITIAGIQTATFDTQANTLTHSGVISGATGNLTKIGNGTLTLSGANTYGGITNAQAGTLKLDFNAAGAPASNIISSTSTLVTGQYIPTGTSGAGPATLQIQGADNAASTQAFASTTFGRGATHLNFTAGAGTGTLNVNLGLVNRNTLAGVIDSAAPQGSTLDISIGANVTVAASGNVANGILAPSNHAAVTFNGNTWATISGGNITGYTGYTTSFATSTNNVDVSGVANFNTSTVNTLRFNSAGAATLNLTAGGVRQLAAGGILVTSNVGANLTTIGAGILAGAGRRDLIIHQNNTLGDLQIDATIVDFNAGNQFNTKSGLGKVIFTANNTNTGATIVNEGTLVVTGDVVAAPTGITGSTAATSTTTVSVTTTVGLFLGQSVTGNTTYFTATNLPSYNIVAIDSINNTITLSNPVVGGPMPAGTALTFGGAGGLGTGAVTHSVGVGATLQIGNGGTTGALTTNQNILNNGAVIFNRSNDLTVANIISGTGTLEKQGGGNMTLSSANTHFGDTKISGGSLILANTSALANSTLDYNSYGGTVSFGTLTGSNFGGLKGNQDLVLTNVATTPAAVALSVGANHQSTTYSGDLSGLGSITKTGGGTLTLTGDNTYAGSTNANNGTLVVAGTHVGNGSFNAANAATLTLSGTITGNGSVNLNSALSATSMPTVNISGSLTGTGAHNVNSGFYNVTGTVSNAGSLTVGAIAGTATATLSGTGSYTTTAGRDVLLGNTVSGSIGILNVQDNASLTVLNNGANNGSIQLGNVAGGVGVINQSGGTISLESNIVFGSNALGAASAYGFYNQSGGQLLHNGGTGTGARFRIGNAAGSNIGLYYLSGGSATYTNGNNAIEVGGSGTFNTGSNSIGVLYVTGTGTMTGATASLQVANQSAGGAGTATTVGQVTIGGAGSTSAGITVLSVNTASNNASQPGTATINLLSGGTLTTGNISKGASGTGTINFNGGTLKIGTNSTSMASGLTVFSHAGGATVDTNGSTYTINAAIQAPTASGVSSIAVTDGGADYAGAPAVTISGGTGTGATAVANVVNGVVTGITVTNPGTGYSPGDVLTVTLSGGGATTTATVGTVTLAANTSGGLTKNNAGTLTLTAANTYTGATTINGGTVALSGAGALADTSNVNVASGTSSFNVSGITASGETVGSLSGVAGSTVVLGAKTLTVGGGNGSASYAGVISGTNGNLTKIGTGTQTLTGTNTYTGTTIVNGGALQVGNAGVGSTGTGAVTVNGTATLLGTGTVKGSSFTLASGATLRPGDGLATSDIGALTFSPTTTGSYTLASGSTTVLGITDSAIHDLLTFNGTSGSSLIVSGNIIVEGASFTPTAGMIFDLIDWMGTVTADFSGFNVGTNFRDGSDDDSSQFNLPNISGSGYAWDISNFTTNGSISLAVVPEPSRALLLIGGLGALMLRRRRTSVRE